MMVGLNFGGSIWCNVAITLRHMNAFYKHETQSLGLAVIEWYILRTLNAVRARWT